MENVQKEKHFPQWMYNWIEMGIQEKQRCLIQGTSGSTGLHPNYSIVFH